MLMMLFSTLAYIFSFDFKVIYPKCASQKNKYLPELDSDVMVWFGLVLSKISQTVNWTFGLVWHFG
jgi:hypothetical protein